MSDLHEPAAAPGTPTAVVAADADLAGTPPAPAGRPSALNVPNLLTVLRIVLVPLFGALLLAHHGQDPTLRWWAFAAFAVASLTDRFDGDLARRWGQVTDLGKMLDPIADKALMGMAFVGLSILDLVPWWVTVVVLGRELVITVMRFLLVRRAIIPASKGGKLKTFLQAIACGVLVWPVGGWVHGAALVVLAAAVVVTLATGADYLLRGWRIWRSTQRVGQ